MEQYCAGLCVSSRFETMCFLHAPIEPPATRCSLASPKSRIFAQPSSVIIIWNGLPGCAVLSGRIEPLQILKAGLAVR